MKYVLCKKCFWVHFEVSREHAESEVKKFNEYFQTLSEEDKDRLYGGIPSMIQKYERCNMCGGSYKNFRVAKSEEVPFGSRVGPIIGKKE